MRFTTKRGATLFICILSSAVLSFCGIFVQAARYRLTEAEIYRAVSAQINQIFIKGGGGMTSRYGVSCFVGSPGDLPVFDRMTGPLDLALTAREERFEPVTEPVGLLSAVNDYMRYRLPVILAVQVVSRIQSVAEELDKAPGSIPEGILGDSSQSSIGQTLSEWLTRFDFTDYLTGPEPLTEDSDENGTDGEGEASTFLDDLRLKIRGFLMDRILGEDLLLEIQRIQSCLSRVQSENGAVGTSGFDFPDLFDPAAVSRFLSNMDDWFSLDADPVYQKCGHVEYVMGMCSRVVPENGRNSPDYVKGFDGRDFTALSSSEGPDVERIITGQSEADPARNWTSTALLGIRFAVCAINNFADPARFEKARAAAVALSGVVALISGGAVVLPEAPLSVIVASVWSLAEAFDESDRIRQGEGVPLCPGLDPILLHYDDYLRLLLYLVPDDRILERLGQVMRKNVAGEFYRGLTITTAFRGREMALTGRCPT